jgi:hypothetical protein
MLWPAISLSAMKGEAKFVSDNQKLLAHFSVAPSPLNARELEQFKAVTPCDRMYVSDTTGVGPAGVASTRGR